MVGPFKREDDIYVFRISSVGVSFKIRGLTSQNEHSRIKKRDFTNEYRKWICPKNGGYSNAWQVS